MPKPPHEVKLLSEAEKKAYRTLLYDAMIDIRTLCVSRGSESRNPFEWRRQYRLSRVAGALADWLHNLAAAAASDFNRIDAVWFWFEYDGLCQRFGDQVGPGKWIDYRLRYDEHLANLSKS